MNYAIEKRDIVLEVNNLKRWFPIHGGLYIKTGSYVKAVDGISFKLYKGETLGLVGESGCGKSTLARTILRLIEPTEGSVFFEGIDILKLNSNQMREKRKDMQIVFQDPFGSLNPKMKIGDIIEEPLKVHDVGTAKERVRRVIELLETVGLMKEYTKRYPHEFSGGQRQRIVIARALTLNPKLIICDEPVSALDVSVRSQILNLLEDLQEELGLTYLFISHDLSVVEHLCNRVAVMYLGKIVELADKTDLFNNPLHPYTQALMSAIPTIDTKLRKEQITLEGDVPSPVDPPKGCRFHTRCKYKMEICKIEPPLINIGNEHYVACHQFKN